MKYRGFTLCVPTAIICLTLAVSLAAAPVTLFAGKAAKKRLSSWGNGKISVSDGEKFEKHKVLEIKTKGYCEGGYLQFDKPRPLGQYLQAPAKSSVAFTVKLGTTQPQQTGGGGRGGGRPGRPTPGGQRGGGGQAPGGGMPGGGFPGLPQGATDTTPNRQLAKSSTPPADTEMFYAQLPGLPGGGGGGGQQIPGGQAPQGGGGQQGPMMPGLQGGQGPGGMGGMAPGLGMEGMGPGGMRPPGRPAPAGRGRAQPEFQPTEVPLHSVRCTLITNLGQLDAGAFRVEDTSGDDDWKTVKVSFADTKGPARRKWAKMQKTSEGEKAEKGEIQAVVFTGNSNGSFYIGKIELQ